MDFILPQSNLNSLTSWQLNWEKREVGTSSVHKTSKQKSRTLFVLQFVLASYKANLDFIFGRENCCAYTEIVRQARSRKSLGSWRLPGDGPDHPHLPGNFPCPSPLIYYWMRTLWACSPIGAVEVLKAPEKEKHAFSEADSTCTHHAFCFFFPFLTW
jgi:hypothetical protein